MNLTANDKDPRVDDMKGGGGDHSTSGDMRGGGVPIKPAKKAGKKATKKKATRKAPVKKAAKRR